jgi:predicted nucleic acid-binding Zn ribbon protein
MIGSKGNLMRPLAHAIPGALLLLLRDSPLSTGKVGFAWRTAVGPALGRVTSVHLEGAVLQVDAASPQWAQEVMRSSPVILRRLEGFLGPGTVERIEVRRA